MIAKLIVAFLFLQIVWASYIPEMSIALSSDFFNKEFTLKGGPILDKLIKNLKVPNVTYQGTYIVHARINMTNITQEADINWNTSLINVTGERSFSVHAKKIKVKIYGKHFEYHLVVERISQSGSLLIQLSEIDVLTKISLVRMNCQGGIGFGVMIDQMIVDSTKLKINITFKNQKGKQIDKSIINIIEKQIINKIQNVVDTKIKELINEQIGNLTCNAKIQEFISLGTQSYLVSINTTDIPYFADRKFLTLPLDINFKNIKTNQTNSETDNENLVDDHIYEGQANCTATISSNMIDTIVWLIDDSKMFSKTITKEQIGDKSPISLDTTGLSILMPGLKQFPNKDVVLRINTSSQQSKVYIRSGRFLSGFSISVQFIINDTSRIQDLDKCLQKRECFVATALNITLGISASAKISKFSFLTSLVQALYLHEIKVINSIIDIKIPNLMKIFNSLISSARPQINNILQSGLQLNISSINSLKKLNITGIIGETFLDYASFGIRFDL